MKARSHLTSHNHTLGLTTSDTYTMAWVSLVPSKDLSRPAWPAALDYVRSQQLEDGGWGDNQTYHAHDRVMSTLAALWALAEWHLDSQDGERIARGVDALHRYAADLQQEPYETIGFELILPQLVQAVKHFGIDVPAQSLAYVGKDTTRKLKRIGQLDFSDGQPKSWWFSAEGLPEERLASVGDTLNRFGGFGITPSATAACLRSLRRHGQDSLRAFRYIGNLVDHGNAYHLWPIDNFELAWTLDFYRRAQIDTSSNAMLLLKLAEQWNLQRGMGFSSAFPVIDGDSTAIAYTVLHWAGLKPSDEPLMYFWRDDTFHTYIEEYKASASAHVHALTAFRQDGKGEHKRAAVVITEWLKKQTLPLQDKWHISPFYATSRLIPALIGWDNEFATQCIESLLEHQQEDGGWGYRAASSSAEETSYVVLGLMAAWQAGLLNSIVPLRQAKCYLANRPKPTERLWIGKVLYQPIGVTQNAIAAAQYMLESIVTEECTVHKPQRQLTRLPVSTPMGTASGDLGPAR